MNPVPTCLLAHDWAKELLRAVNNSVRGIMFIKGSLPFRKM